MEIGPHIQFARIIETVLTNIHTAHTLFNVGTYAKLGFNDCASQFAMMPQEITFKTKQYSL